MNVLDIIVRAASVLLLAIVFYQLAGLKGGTWHVRLGNLAGWVGAIVLLAVSARGIMEFGKPHGPLYGAHLLLSIPFFVSLVIAVRSGRQVRRGNVFMIRRHGIAAWCTVASLVALLAFGLVSRLLR